MSRFERDIGSSGGTPLGDPELQELLAACSALGSRERQEAIACYLSASEGWDEALKALRGAFANDAAEAVRWCRSRQNKHDVNQRASEYLQWQALKPAGTDND